MSWSLNKREFLAGSAAGAAWALGNRWFGGATSRPRFEDRIAAALIDEGTYLGRALALEARSAGLRTVSVEAEEAALWRNARGGFGLAPGDAMIGLTGWADWTALRPVLASHRKRARAEFRIDGDDIEPARLAEALNAGLHGGSVTRLRFGTPRGARAQFAWLVA